MANTSHSNLTHMESLSLSYVNLRLNISQYPPYNIYVHVTILTIMAAYIPVIVVSSVFVIAAVIYVRKLHNSHNYILTAISGADLLVAVLVIPTHVLQGVPATREFIFDHMYLCGVVHTLQDCVESTELCLLTLLGLDTFLQIKCPVQYRKHSTKTNVKNCIIAVIVINVCISVSFFGIALFGGFSCDKMGSLQTNINKVHALHHKITFLTLLIVCFLSGVYVRWRSWRRGQTMSEKVTMVLLMVFIIFYTPTVVLFFELHYLDNSQQELYMYISRAIRYLCPLTNGVFIYMSRHVYNTAFRFFIKTKPWHWKRIEKRMTYIAQRISVPYLEKDIVLLTPKSEQKKKQREQRNNSESLYASTVTRTDVVITRTCSS